MAIGCWRAGTPDFRIIGWRWSVRGLRPLLLSVVFFGTLSVSFFPPQNSDYSRVNITMPPGTTLKGTEATVDKVAAIIAKDPSVDRVFERINVGEGHVNIVLKKHRKLKSTEFERNLGPTLAALPDTRASFQSQQGGGPDADLRDIMLYLGGDDPVRLTAAANQIAKEMETVPGLRAPRVGSNLAQPEITIKPRFDLAADLGVTTAALSQTVRIATLGDIEQNSAKFALSDRQVPIQVSLSENELALTWRCALVHLPVPREGGRWIGSLKGGCDSRIWLGADDDPALEPASTTVDRCRSCAGRGPGRRVDQGQQPFHRQAPAPGNSANEPW